MDVGTSVQVIVRQLAIKTGKFLPGAGQSGALRQMVTRVLSNVGGALFARGLGVVVAANIYAAVLPSCGALVDDTGTETHWLQSCDSDAECNGPTSCLCGVCTIACERDDACPEQAPVCAQSDDNSCSGSAAESICLKSQSRASDDESAAVEQPDAGETFSWELYSEIMCNYYASCSPAARRQYGDREQCLDVARKFYQQADTTGLPSFAEPVWDAKCLAELSNISCPQGANLNDELVVQQHMLDALFACGRPELMGCNDDGDCWGIWECSVNDDGGCGTCQAPPSGTCRRSFIDCSSDEYCLDGVCSARKPNGSACELFEECWSGRCRGVCVEAQPEGSSCTTIEECASYLWCDDGVCSAPAGPGEVCAGGDNTLASCQYGYICDEGQCQEYEWSDVAEGDACFSSSNCVKGAECVDWVCVESALECAFDEQCAEGQYCDTECLQKRPNGAECSRDKACVSGFCSEDNVCADGNPCD